MRLSAVNKVPKSDKVKLSHLLPAQRPSIVGFGAYQYRYESGHSGEAPLTGLAVRGRELVIYISCEDPEQGELLAQLGKHKMGKSCLYFKHLADLDAKVLEQLVAGSVAEVQRRHPALT